MQIKQQLYAYFFVKEYIVKQGISNCHACFYDISLLIILNVYEYFCIAYLHVISQTKFYYFTCFINTNIHIEYVFRDAL